MSSIYIFGYFHLYGCDFWTKIINSGHSEVLNSLEFFFQWLRKYLVELFCWILGRPPTAKKEGTGRNKKRRGRVCKLDTGSPCTLKILLLVANLFTAHTQKKTNLCSRNLQRCDRRSQVVTPFGNLRCVCMQYIFKNQKTDKLNLLSLGCKLQFCSSTRLKVNLKLLANTGSATRNWYKVKTRLDQMIWQIC